MSQSNENTMITLPAIHCPDPIFHPAPPSDGRYICAISQYCQVIGPRKPIYSLKDTKDGLCICNLTLPGDAPCMVIQVKTKRCHAKSVAARDACAKLIEKGEMDENLSPLRAPRVAPGHRNFGNVKLSEVRQRELGLSLVPIEILHVALEPHSGDITSSSWEILGDAFLKFFWGTYFFAQHQDESEGTLTIRIHNETQRAALMEYLVSSGIASNVCTKPGQSSYGVNGGTEIIRRVIGAAVAHGGVNTAMEITRALGAGVDTSLASMNSIRVVHQLNRAVDLNTPITICNAQIPRMIDTETAITMQKVQDALGYQFKDIQLLLEAMTHKKAKMETSYDRLEFLGDAVLEIAVTECYYRQCPDASFKDFEEFKRQLLSNNALGSLYASLGLEDAIIVGSPRFKVALKNEAARARRFTPNKQTGWCNMNLEKTLGDAFEALIGAVFVDAEFDIEPVHEVLRHTLMPFIDRSGLECPKPATCPTVMTTSSAAALPVGGKRKKKRSAGSRKRAKNQ